MMKTTDALKLNGTPLLRPFNASGRAVYFCRRIDVAAIGGPRRAIMGFDTVASHTSTPNFNNLPWVRAARHHRLARDILWISFRISALAFG